MVKLSDAILKGELQHRDLHGQILFIISLTQTLYIHEIELLLSYICGEHRGCYE